MMMTTMVTINQTETQYNNGYVQEEYMLQEDEWDRDLLLDPAWEKQQRKVRVVTNPVCVREREALNGRDSVVLIFLGYMV